MNIIKIGLNEDAYKVAVENTISYYDAAYIHAAISQKEPIVSEDKKLLEIASKYNIKSYTIEEIL